MRNLFQSSAFNLNHTVSTILAQIVCFNNTLPQGAPTSPIISNIIAWKLDSQLQQLAKAMNSTYTRYADDISFSFTCSRRRLPRDIVVTSDDAISPGHTLTNIIEQNGFNINYSKVRLCSANSRMEITGLNVNEFVNVRRQYIRQLGSMLYAWEKFGYKKAEDEYNSKYNGKHRPSRRSKSYLLVLRGKLAFLRSVRTHRDPIFNKLASRFNDLAPETHRFRLFEMSNPEKNAIAALWVIESCYDDGGEEPKGTQGTGFQIQNGLIVTCAHVIGEIGSKEIYKEIEAFKHDNLGHKFILEVERVCWHRDVAICRVSPDANGAVPSTYIDLSSKSPNTGDSTKLLGYPNYSAGSSPYMVDCKIARMYPASGVHKFEIDHTIRAGNSGGPLLDNEVKALGIALEGAHKDGGHNGCLTIPELHTVLGSDDYLVHKKSSP